MLNNNINNKKTNNWLRNLRNRFLQYKYVVCIAIVLFMYVNPVNAQDFHFSQFYSNPTILNPAMTGNLANDYRVGVLNKTHLFDQVNQYQTVTGFADIALLEGEISRDSWLGVGVNFLHDNAGIGLLKSIRTGASVAFHTALVSDALYLSMGLDFNYVRKQFDLSDVYFNNQFGSDGLDSNLSNGEAIYREKIQYLDVGGGLNFAFVSGEMFRVDAGVGFMHLNRPRETLYFASNNSGRNRRTVRPVFTLKSDIELGVIGIHPGIIYSRDKGAQELIGGTHVSFVIVPNVQNQYDARLFVGGWYRVGEAVIASIGLGLGEYRLMLSYDANVNNLRNGSPNRQGFEVSFIHSGGFRPAKTRMHCPRF